jgi:hypothetical protein
MSMNATGSLSERKCTEYTLLQKYHTVVYSTIPPQSNCMYIHPVYVTFYSNIQTLSHTYITGHNAKHIDRGKMESYIYTHEDESSDFTNNSKQHA